MDYLSDTFSADAALCSRVLAAAQQNRDQLQLFVDVARYLTRPRPADASQANGTDEPSSKKRKLDGAATASASNGIPSPGPATSFDRTHATKALDVPDVSFSVPVRKKLHVEMWSGEGEQQQQGGSGGGGGGGGMVMTGKDVHYEFSWARVSRVFCVPVPEKAARQHNFVVLLGGSNDDDAAAGTAEQFVFALSETPYAGPMDGGQREGDTWVSVTGRAINTALARLGKGGVVLPDPAEFESAIPQAHRKGEAGYHVKAFLGSKDGYLFFLSTGILWGFRKPIQHLGLESIASISYTSVLQRTFNLVINVFPPTSSVAEDGAEGPEGKEIEFSMLDQADFAGIDAYVKRHGLNDASMAKERQAKRLNVNGTRKRDVAADGEAADGEGGEPGADDGEDEETELQKAERELQDAEDEEEEDYDPSGGESEGEGEDSEEEDGGDNGEDVAEEGEA